MSAARVTVRVYRGHPWDRLGVNVVDFGEDYAATSIGTFLRVGERFEHSAMPLAWFPAGDLPAAGVSMAEDRGFDHQKRLGDTVGDNGGKPPR